MESTALENPVSEEALKAAEEFAKDLAMKFEGKRHLIRSAAYAGFLAGVAYMKPIEHNQQPINGHGKESENNQNSI